MANRNRNLERVERVAKAPAMDAPTEGRGEAAAYIRELIARANRGELSKGKPATDEKRSKTWLELEVAKVAHRLNHRAHIEGAKPMVRHAHTEREANPTGADGEPLNELLARLLLDWTSTGRLRALTSDRISGREGAGEGSA